MSDERALLAAIYDNPEEDTPRLMYADWLDEQGGAANAARAEFIRVQCECSRLDDLRDQYKERYEQLEARAQELEKQYRKQWLAEFPSPNVGDNPYSHGFLNRMTLDATKCLKVPRPRWYREPFLRLTLRSDADTIQKLCDTGWLDGVSDLDLSPSEHEDANPIAQAVAASSCAPTLRILALWDDGFTDLSLQTVAAGSFGELRELSCMGRFTPKGWETVLNSPAVTRLEDLTIGHRGPWQTADRERPGPALGQVLVDAPVHSQLKYLWLTDCGLQNAGLTRLASGGKFTKLERLHLDTDKPGLTAITSLGRGHFPALTEIRLCHCDIGDADVGVLAVSPLMARLEKIDLSSNELTTASAMDIATSGQTQKLKYLNLGFNRIADRGVIVLARSRNFPALEEMHLTSVGMTDAGADAVLHARWAGQLTTLFLSYNPISLAKRDELTARFGSVIWIATPNDEDDEDDD
jgi:uncharacterized protein (TIGR02996 family)